MRGCGHPNMGCAGARITCAEVDLHRRHELAGAVLRLGVSDAGVGPVIAEQLQLFVGGAVEQLLAVGDGKAGNGIETEAPLGMREADEVHPEVPLGFRHMTGGIGEVFEMQRGSRKRDRLPAITGHNLRDQVTGKRIGCKIAPLSRFKQSTPDREIFMRWLRIFLGSVFFLTNGALIQAGGVDVPQCNVPAGYYRLVDVESDGAIEFRQHPTHRSPLLSALEVGGVVESDGTRSPGDTTWQKVKIMRTEGWVPARKLWRALPLTLEKSAFPAAGWCGDSSPLWSMTWDGKRVRFSLYPGRFETAVHSVKTSGNSASTLVSGSAPGMSYNVIYSEDVCRDLKGGMLGLGRAHLIVSRNGEQEIYSGCCTISASAFSSRPLPGSVEP